MQITQLDGLSVHWRQDGPDDGAPVLFANSLGTDFRLWDKVVPLLPPGLRLIRYDKRGHGLTELPHAPWDMDRLAADAAALLDHLGLRDVVVVGLSIGGLIAQRMAATRPELVKAVVLSNTGSKIGSAQMWADRIAGVEANGVESLADAVMERWFSESFRQTAEMAGWRNMLARTSDAGYAGCSRAIAACDLTDGTAGLRLPALGIAGTADGSTPPDVVRAMMGLIPGSRTEVMEGPGHLPCVEQPEAYAALLKEFFREVDHG